MSLFVGNISRNVRTRDLEDEFDKFGPCSVNHRVK
jgi:RNA recognition motif-containing protein